MSYSFQSKGFSPPFFFFLMLVYMGLLIFFIFSDNLLLVYKKVINFYMLVFLSDNFTELIDLI